MNARSLQKPAQTAAPAENGYTDDTGPRIRAYLASVRPRRGVAGVGEEEEYQRGRSLIERVALSAHGDGSPTLRLTATQCADVVNFVRQSDPVTPRTWWSEPADAPSHLVGLCFVLDAVESSLRGKGGAA